MSEQGMISGQQFYLTMDIKGIKYNPSNLQYFIIREWIYNILPTIEMQFLDDGYLSEVFPLEDQEDIKIVLAKHEDDENPIEMIFSVDDCSYEIKGDNRKIVISINGHLKADKMFILKSRSFSIQNSSSVLSNIASENNLTFLNPHNIVPSDNMIWYQINQSNFDFIKHVLKRSYIPDDVLMFYARVDKKFILTSLKREIDKREIKKSKFSIENYERNDKDEDDKDDTIWFSNYSIVNNSGFFNKRIGYGFGYSYFDLNDVVSETYSTIPKLTQLSFRNKNMKDITVRNETYAEINLANIYSEKFYESMTRNRFLISNFFANSLVLNINALSKVNLMDTIDVYIPSLMQEDNHNEVLSGFYLVAGIQHEVSNGGIYKKKIALGRNGFNKNPDLRTYNVEEL